MNCTVTETSERKENMESREQKQGRRGRPEIIGHNGRNALYAAPCSECGAYSREYWKPFCPDCGARLSHAEMPEEERREKWKAAKQRAAWKR